jgi:hypothetical protein
MKFVKKLLRSSNWVQINQLLNRNIKGKGY